MAQPNSPTANWTFSRGEGPWLLPYNRKLRNLVSISLRNLNLTPTSPGRRRGKTIDDDALPNTLKSPAKLVALREQKALGLSRSSTDLRAVAENAVAEAEDVLNVPASANGSPKAGKEKHRRKSATTASPRRPEFRKLRRRSTLEWAQSSPQTRQERLEKMTKERMADVFFSLHVNGIEEPVYVSEIVGKTMNPTFRHVDWTHCGPGVTRLDQVVLRVWVQGGKVDEWQQLLQLELQLTGLQYVGKSLDDLNRALPQNAVLLHLSDGVYTSFTDSLADFAPLHPPAPERKKSSSSQRAVPTSSFDALLRLSKLDDSIQDALATRDQIANQLEDLLQRNKEPLEERDKVAEARDRLKTIEFAKKTVEKQLEKAHKQQEEKRSSLAARRQLMQSDLLSREEQHQKIQSERPKVPEMRDEDRAKTKDIHNQRRRICEDLQVCYPILPQPGKTLAFTIRDLHLPNSEDLDSEPPETQSAALGHVAHALQMLAFYLSQSLPYPISPLGSTSTVYDPISILKSNSPFPSRKNDETALRTYPLFTKGVPRFRFEYAVFLINQDIRVLLENAFNLKVLDIRQTLPNLKYLLYVATAGEGDLPARKAGGVRGLVRVPVMQRTGSNDSFGSNMSGSTLRENGRPRGAADRLRQISAGKGKEGMKVK